MLVQFEREIDREIARDQKRERAGSTGDGSGSDLNSASNGNDSGAGMEEEDDEEEEEDYNPLEFGPVPQIVTNDLKSLDEMVSTDHPQIYIHIFSQLSLILFCRTPWWNKLLPAHVCRSRCEKQASFKFDARSNVASLTPRAFAYTIYTHLKTRFTCSFYVCVDLYVGYAGVLCRSSNNFLRARPFASFFSRRAACRSIGMCAYVCIMARAVMPINMKSGISRICSESRAACERRQRPTCISALGAVTLQDPESNSIIWPPPGSARLPTMLHVLWLYGSTRSCSSWK